MYTKLLSILFFVFAVAAVDIPEDTCVMGQEHSMELGNRKNGERRVFQGVMVMFTNSGIIEKDMIWTGEMNEEITYIEILDQNKKGLGGCVRVVAGGVGQNFIQLHMMAHKTGTLNFFINIYAKKYL